MFGPMPINKSSDKKEYGSKRRAENHEWTRINTNGCGETEKSVTKVALPFVFMRVHSWFLFLEDEERSQMNARLNRFLPGLMFRPHYGEQLDESVGHAGRARIFDARGVGAT
jgi:hypothetical protein